MNECVWQSDANGFSAAAEVNGLRRERPKSVFVKVPPH